MTLINSGAMPGRHCQRETPTRQGKIAMMINGMVVGQK
jgi:hypothetical protein